MEDEDEGFDDNGFPSCYEEAREELIEDQSLVPTPKSVQDCNYRPSPKEVDDGEDDNGVESSFVDGRNATGALSSAQEKKEDPGRTTQTSCEQNNFSKPDDTIEDCKDSALKVKAEEGPRQAPSDETKTEECIGESERTVDDESGSTEKTLDDESGSTEKTVDDESGSTEKTLDDESGSTEKTLDDESGSTEKTLDDESGSTEKTVDDESGSAEKTVDDESGSTEKTVDDESGSTEKTVDNESGSAEKTLDDESGSTEKTVVDECGSTEKTVDNEISLIDSYEDEAQTYETGEPTQADSLDNGARVLPASSGIEGTSSSGRGNVATPLGGDMEPFGPSRDGSKRLFELSHQDGNVRKTTKQRDNASSDESGHTDKDANNHSAKSAKLSSVSTKLNFLAIVVYFFGFAFNTGAMALTVIPGDVLASSGSTARLRCSTDYKSPVYWDRKLFGSDEQETIYYGKNGMARIAGGRIRVEEDSSSGRYDLIISDVQMEDAGTYTCIDEAGIGEGYPAELVVYERFTCEMPVPRNGFMGENIFEIPEDPVESTCSLSYRGSVVPRFQWTWGKVARLLTPTSINGSTVTSSVMFRATHDMNGVRLTCLPIVSTDADSLDDSPRWISELVVVRYVHVMFGSVDECRSNAMIPVCNPNCSYKVQETPDNRCQCLAVYNDQERTYNKIFSEYSCGISESSSNVIIIVVVIVVAFAVLVAAAGAIGLIVVVLRKIRRKEGRRPEEKSEIGETNQISNDSISIEIEKLIEVLIPVEPDSAYKKPSVS